VVGAGLLISLRVEVVHAASARSCCYGGLLGWLDGPDLVHVGDLDGGRLYLTMNRFTSRGCLKIRLGGGEKFHPGHPVNRGLPAGLIAQGEFHQDLYTPTKNEML